MKVAYLFISPGSIINRLYQSILPQLESGTHNTEVVGLCFFDDNSFVLNAGDPIGKRLTALASEKSITLMTAEINMQGHHDIWAYPDDYQSKRSLKPNERVVVTVMNGQEVACYPDIYTALAGNLPDHIISL